MMKKLLILFIAFIGALTVKADDTYPYLTFEMTDGEKVSVNTSSLTMSISGNTLTVGEQSFTLTNLSKMYFTTSDETSTDIKEITQDALEEAIDIYDLQGHQVTKEQMKRGVYIIKTKKQTYKIIRK